MVSPRRLLLSSPFPVVMPLATACGYLVVGAGPWCSVFALVTSRSSFLVLLTFASSFYYLVVLLLAALPLRPFMPLAPSAGSYFAFALFTCVVKEVMRYALFRMFRKGVTALEDSVASGQLAEQAATDGVSVRGGLLPSDYVKLSLAVGQGYGLGHFFFFFLSVLSLTLGDGTWYGDRCPEMSLFTILAVLALAYSMIHAGATVVAFHRGYGSGWEGARVREIRARGVDWTYAGIVFAGELVASLFFLVNFAHGGCTWGVPLTLLCGVAFALWGLVEARRVVAALTLTLH